jgi:hypothetical protein
LGDAVAEGRFSDEADDIADAEPQLTRPTMSTAIATTRIFMIRWTTGSGDRFPEFLEVVEGPLVRVGLH